MGIPDSEPPPTARRVVVVLGMHRSGTSAITRVCGLLGASLPKDLLPSDPDNESGYWESRELLGVNRALLDAAGTTWFDDLPISDTWFRSSAAEGLRPRALALVEHLFRTEALVALKDPRLCRLWPFWQSIFEELQILPRVILAVRHPMAVARSLNTRAERPEIRSAAITCAAKSHLLWLRYVLESERQTRAAVRSVATYDGLLAHPAETTARVAADLGCFPLSPTDVAPALNEFLQVRLRHHHINEDAEALASAVRVYECLAEHADHGSPLDLDELDAARHGLDAVEAAYAPLRWTGRRTSATASRWEPEMLQRLDDRLAGRGRPTARVLFVSGDPATRGHVYRVVHPVAALQAAGWSASWISIADLPTADARAVDVVVIWRAPWSDAIAQFHEACRTHGVIVGFDADDLVFDPAVMTTEHSDFLRRSDATTRDRWLTFLVPGYARTLAACDFALMSTAPLARAAQVLGTRAYVLPNGLDAAMITAAGAAVARRARGRPDGYVRLGYASGTPTHQRDFAVVAPVVASLLEATPGLILTIVGCLDLEEFSEFRAFRERIEQRPLVPFGDRFEEYARFDVNLAPLEQGNPFCEGKSELKYFEPALVGVTTVASATAPFASAIMQGETGFCALTAADWSAAIQRLVSDPVERGRVGGLARVHAIASFGPETQRDRARAIFSAIAQRPPTNGAP